MLPATRANELLRVAQVQLARHDTTTAVATLERAIQVAPHDSRGYVLRGLAEVSQGRYDTALPYFKRAVVLSPGDGNAWMFLGAALYETGAHQEAIAALERACREDPALAAAWYNLGRTYKLLRRNDAALHALDEALRLEPNNIKARLTRADALVSAGAVDAGVADYKAVLLRHPADPHAWFGLANLKTYKFTEAEVSALRHALLHTNTVKRDTRILLGFALAAALDACADYGAAWTEYEKANQLECEVKPWNRDEFHRRIEAVRQASASLASPDTATSRGHGVIFIVSLPRAGSTLIEQILASHPDVTGANEINVAADLLVEESTRRGKELPAWSQFATAADWARLGEIYLARTARYRQTTAYFTDKSLGTWQILGFVRRMLPDATFIHCHRDPLENCFSCYRQWFAQGCRFTYDLDDLASHYADYQRLMACWQLQAHEKLLDESYETLVSSPEQTIREVLTYCGLPFDEACLTPEQTNRTVTSTASAAQVRKPITASLPRSAAYGALSDPLRAALGRYGAITVASRCVG